MTNIVSYCPCCGATVIQDTQTHHETECIWFEEDIENSNDGADMVSIGLLR